MKKKKNNNSFPKINDYFLLFSQGETPGQTGRDKAENGGFEGKVDIFSRDVQAFDGVGSRVASGGA